MIRFSLRKAVNGFAMLSTLLFGTQSSSQVFLPDDDTQYHLEVSQHKELSSKFNIKLASFQKNSAEKELTKLVNSLWLLQKLNFKDPVHKHPFIPGILTADYPGWIRGHTEAGYQISFSPHAPRDGRLAECWSGGFFSSKEIRLFPGFFDAAPLIRVHFLIHEFRHADGYDHEESFGENGTFSAQIEFLARALFADSHLSPMGKAIALRQLGFELNRLKDVPILEQPLIRTFGAMLRDLKDEIWENLLLDAARTPHFEYQSFFLFYHYLDLAYAPSRDPRVRTFFRVSDLAAKATQAENMRIAALIKSLEKVFQKSADDDGTPQTKVDP